jgi:hypothetical protein
VAFEKIRGYSSAPLYDLGPEHALRCPVTVRRENTRCAKTIGLFTKRGDDMVSTFAIREELSLALVTGTNAANRGERRVQRVFSHRHSGRHRSR